MKAIWIAGLILLNAIFLQAADFSFSLKYLESGPITLHTAVTYEGRGERLVATAINESGAPIRHVKMCIFSYAMKEGCLFEISNTEVWEPGAELHWTSTFPKKLRYLKHDVILTEFEVVESTLASR